MRKKPQAILRTVSRKTWSSCTGKTSADCDKVNSLAQSFFFLKNIAFRSHAIRVYEEICKNQFMPEQEHKLGKGFIFIRIPRFSGDCFVRWALCLLWGSCYGTN